MSFGEKVQTLRKVRGLSQEQLAGEMNIGVMRYAVGGEIAHQKRR